VAGEPEVAQHALRRQADSAVTRWVKRTSSIARFQGSTAGRCENEAIRRWRRPCCGLLADMDDAHGRLDQVRHDASSGLAATGRADKRHETSGLDVEIDDIQRLRRSEPAAYPFDRNRGEPPPVPDTSVAAGVRDRVWCG